VGALSGAPLALRDASAWLDPLSLVEELLDEVREEAPRDELPVRTLAQEKKKATSRAAVATTPMAEPERLNDASFYHNRRPSIKLAVWADQKGR
jgi:hypothetical protein